MATNGSASSNDTNATEAVVYIEATIAEGLWVYCAPLIIILGTIGNTLALIILTRKNMRKSTSSVYLSVLAVVDTMVLYTGLLRYWIIYISDVDIRDITLGGCKVHIFIVYYTVHLSAWILVVVTSERLIAVYIPHKAQVYCTHFSTLITLCVLFAVFFVTNLHFFWTFGYIEINDNGEEEVVCIVADDKYTDFFLDTWSWLDTCIASFIPFTIMFVSNVLIIIKVVFWRSIRKMSSANESKMTTMTAMLLTVNFVFIICTAPIVIYLNFYTEWYPDEDDQSQMAKSDLHWAVCNMLQYSSNAINFLLYCVSGPKFRRELSGLWCRKKNQVVPHSNSQTDAETVS
ncbi:unnamed protein product [Owenia fusiformis]|uniref:G-protein coupled receptors family 1 profile domain-containing protein n=1 Tax=Owenia fusiformis TaxID=6347 RepID=A0A8S4PTS8_OWEFU|nr:unnamed protein product [Owenia fusiformis]